MRTYATGRTWVLVVGVLAGACAARPTRPAERSTPVVIGRSITIESKILGETRRINVYTPPGYDDDRRRYPVLYMPDGGIAEDFHHITGIVQVSIGNGTMRPTIVVGIENTERRRDLTGPTQVPEDRAVAPRVGGSADFRRFLREELIPTIERDYRVTEERAIVGESFAGLFVLETLVRAPEMFTTYIAVDPSLWWDAGSLVRDAARALRGLDLRGKTLYFTTADVAEMQEGARAIAEALRQAPPPGLRWYYEPMPDETHATIFHGAALRAFRTVLAPPKTTP